MRRGAGASVSVSETSSNQTIAPTYWTDPKSNNDYFLTVQYPESQVKTFDDLRAIPLHAPGNPRAYFEWIGRVVHDRERAAQRHARVERRTSGLWVPGQPEPGEQEEEEVAPRRPGGLWVPGDRL